jgi:hypothetical protein
MLDLTDYYDIKHMILTLGLVELVDNQTSGLAPLGAGVRTKLGLVWPCLVPKIFTKSTLQHFRLYLTNIIQSWTN